jgi:uncharacterized membrane protein (DUF2068 family)
VGALQRERSALHADRRRDCRHVRSHRRRQHAHAARRGHGDARHHPAGRAQRPYRRRFLTHTGRESRLIWLIALERTLRGLLLLAAGIYLLAKAGANFGDIANHIAARLELDPQRPWIRHLVARLGRLRKHEVQLFGVLAIGYAALEITEGVGLFYRKRWAEWLTVIATSLLVPIEVYELVRHPSWLKAGGIVVNIAIVVYLVRVVRRKSG